nr:uncharacterized protein LOC110373755 isoform X3 [Helicoverpa armigera]
MPRKSKHVPPKNINNNESPEFIDDLVSEEWVDVTDEYVIKNTSKTLPVSSENPPKSDTPCPELEPLNSPKKKKRKLKMPLTFDEILGKLNFNTLYLKFTKLLQFLESGDSEMLFPFITRRYEEFFKMIIQDINILKSRSLDANYRDICDKIIEVGSFKNSGYLLTYNYDLRTEFKNPILVIKKIYTQSPFSLEGTSSSDSNQPSPLPDMEPRHSPKRFKNPTISSSFKIHCLHSALVFVKNNMTKNIEFPELTSEQAEFMQLLLQSIITFADCENVSEVNELYRALWEAVKIHSTKYDFKVNIDSCGDKKSLVFEKLPKQKRVESATYTKQRRINITPPLSLNEHTVTENQSNVTEMVICTNQEISANDSTVSEIQPVVTTDQSMGPNEPVGFNDPVGLKGPAIDNTEPKTEVTTSQPEWQIQSINEPVVSTNQIMGSNELAINTVQIIQTEVTTNEPVVQIQDETMKPTDSAYGPIVNGIDPAVSTKQPTLSLNEPDISVIEPGVSTKQPEVDTESAVGKIEQVDSNQSTDSVIESCPSGPKEPMINPTTAVDINPVVEQPEANNPVTLTNQPVDKKQPILNVNQPLFTLSQPVFTPSQPVFTPSQPVFTPSQPVVTPSQPVFTPSQPVVTPSQPVVSVNGPMTGENKPTGLKPFACYNREDLIIKNPSQKTKIYPPIKPSPKKIQKMKNKATFVYRLPKTFLCNAFKTIIKFLADERRDKMIFVPTTQDELVFYRKCMEWTKVELDAIFDAEYKFYVNQIVEYLSYMKVQVPKPAKECFNLATGIREVTYVKKKKHHCNGKPIVIPPVSEFKIPIIHTSLRNKKKNKKLKNKDLVKLKTPKNKKSVVGVSDNKISKKSSDSSSVSSSSRGTSQERKKKTKKARKIKKRLPTEMDVAPKNTSSNGKKMRWGDDARKEQLIEALSVPVQSDKAMRIMRGMGWSGGALGARGEGITEPIMPVLDLPKGYGFGAYKLTPQPEMVPKKRAPPKPVTVWPTDSSEEAQLSENDIIVEKTKELLYTKPSFDKFMKGDGNQPKMDLEIIDLDAEYPDENYKKAEVPKKTSKAKKTKSETVQAKLIKSIMQIPTQTRHGALLDQNPNYIIEFEPRNFRKEVLETVLEILTTDLKAKSLTFDRPISQKNKQYMMHLLKNLKYSSNVQVAWNEQCLADEIVEKYKDLPDVFVKGSVSDDRLVVEFEKLHIINEDRDTNEIIQDENVCEVTDYIRSCGVKCDTRKALDNLKFRVLTIMKILDFVKSDNEEIEIEFNNVLPKKHRNYIQSALDSINLRHRLGESKPEGDLSDEIKKFIGDVFISHMFNHRYSAVTYSKHFHTKRFHTPPVYEKRRKEDKRKTEEIIDLDNNNSKPGHTDNNPDITDNSEITDNPEITDKPEITDNPDMTDNPKITDKENIETANYEVTGSDYDVTVDGNDVTVDENNVTDNDCIDLSSDEDSFRISPKILPPRDETVSMFEYLCMYDTSNYSFKAEKPNGNVKEEKDNILESQVINNWDIETENQDETMVEIGLNNQIQENIEKEELIEVNKDESSEEISEKSSKMDDDEIIKRIDDIIKTENKTDCDISFDKDDLVLSEENYDNNQSLEASHSKAGEIENGIDITDKKSTEINHVYIVNLHYPTEIITNEKAKAVQEVISKQIMLCKELPLLKCHGVQYGALIYTCHNKNTFEFLENSIKNIGDLKVLNTINVTKMAAKLFCLFDFDSVYLFNMIELYNKEVSTKQWVVESKEFCDGNTIFIIEMDKDSIDFIHASDLSLFAGVDKVEFSLIWE